MKRASLLSELLDPGLSVGRRARLGCDLSRDYENRGEYEEAREVLKWFWPRLGERPKLAGLDQSTAAEVLLRVGVLTGIIGSSHVTDAQGKAKDLITESLTLFQSLRDKTKVAEARIELALCYWRTGENNEALDLLKDALALLIADSELKGKAVIRSAIVDIDAGRLSEALQFLTDNAALFEKIKNPMITGCYHQALGDALKDLWEAGTPGNYLDRALIEYAAASYNFEQADHKRYRANVENNLGLIYFQINQRDEAHKHLDRARRIFTSLKDKNATAQVDETRARVFLKESRNAEAEKVARSSVRILEKSDMQFLLVESLTTHGIALSRLGSYGVALSAFRRAINLAQQIGCLNRASQAALAVFQEMGERLSVSVRRTPIAGRTLDEEVHSLEHVLIKHALEEAKGSVTHAARILGTSYPELRYMLNTRHNDLIGLRTPPRPRKKN